MKMQDQGMRPMPIEPPIWKCACHEADSTRPGLLVDYARHRIVVIQHPPLGADRAGRLMDSSQQGHRVLRPPEAACVSWAVIKPEIDREATPSEGTTPVIGVGVSASLRVNLTQFLHERDHQWSDRSFVAATYILVADKLDCAGRRGECLWQVRRAFQ